MAGIYFIHADNTVGVFFALGIADGHGGTEKHLVAFTALRGIDDFGVIQAFGQETQTAVDFTQASFPVNIIAIAIRSLRRAQTYPLVL